MIDVPTLFILGAGSSRPYGYPSGKELRSDIIGTFYKNLQPLIKASSIDSDEARDLLSGARDFVNSFKKSSIESIDKFLALNPRFALIGKIAITLCILLREQSSKFNESMISPNDREDWYTFMFNRMISTFSEPADINKFSKNKISFITFNYDRSLDYFLYNRFFNAFSEKSSTIQLGIDWINTYLPFPLIHVYGQVDKTVWHGCSNYKNNDNFKYGSVINLSKGIKVIGERSNDSKLNIAKLLLWCKRIFFLGFGYSKENLDAIGIPENINATCKIYGTAKGMTPKEITAVKNALGIESPATDENSKSAGQIDSVLGHCIEDKNSYELLREYL